MRPRLRDRRSATSASPPPGWLGILAKLAAPAGLISWPVDIVLVDDAAIAALNRAWRGCDEPTDVLSFSYLEMQGSGRPKLAAGRRHAARDLWRDPGDDAAGAPVGEIVLAPAFVAAACAAHGWDQERELSLLTVHGLLHVLGWTHDDPSTAAAMRAQEVRLLRGAGLVHPLALTDAGAETLGEEAGEDGAGDR